MKTTTIVLLVLGAVGALLGFSFLQRNSLIAQDEGANKAWANVQAQYQRRVDLIPNLVETVKGATTYEGETLTKITEGRNQLLGLAKELKTAVDSGSPEKVDAIEKVLVPALRAYTGLAQEAYPSLRAVEQFTTLQSQLEGTENRVSVARQDFNQAVASLNTAVRQWGFLPFCGGFKTREAFAAQAGADVAPKVKF